MKRILLVVFLILVAGTVGLMRKRSTIDRNPEVRNSIKQEYALKSGARIDISGIRGFVRVDTSDRSTVDADITVISHGSEDAAQSVTVEQTDTGISIRGHHQGSGFFQRLFYGSERQEITLSAPRDIELVVRGVDGAVTSGAINGSARISGVNGAVELNGVGGFAELSGINGSATVSEDKIDDRGIRVSGVNGGVVLRLAPTINADVTAHGVTGKVRAERLELNASEDQQPRSRFFGRLGSGGAPINLSGINGTVRLVSTREEQ